MENRAPYRKYGNVYACLTALGMDGRSRSYVWVDVRNFPSGIFTTIGSLAGWRLVRGVSMEM